MIHPRICAVKHNPPHTHGDCLRACIATIIDRDDVPHVFSSQGDTVAMWGQLRKWLNENGYQLVLVPVKEHWETMAINNPGVPYILLCSVADGDHAVVCQDGKVAHDPSWYPNEIKGPHSLGAWIIGLVSKIV